MSIWRVAECCLMLERQTQSEAWKRSRLQEALGADHDTVSVDTNDRTGCTFDRSPHVSDPDVLSRFSGSVFFIDFRARRHHHSSSVKPPFDVWSRTFARASSPEVHFVARSEKCQGHVIIVISTMSDRRVHLCTANHPRVRREECLVSSC